MFEITREEFSLFDKDALLDIVMDQQSLLKQAYDTVNETTKTLEKAKELLNE